MVKLLDYEGLKLVVQKIKELIDKKVSTKMDKENPRGFGNFSMNNGVVGENSVAIGSVSNINIDELYEKVSLDFECYISPYIQKDTIYNEDYTSFYTEVYLRSATDKSIDFAYYSLEQLKDYIGYYIRISQGYFEITNVYEVPYSGIEGHCMWKAVIKGFPMQLYCEDDHVTITEVYTKKDFVPAVGNIASGKSSFAEGSGTIASGDYSHAEGASIDSGIIKQLPGGLVKKLTLEEKEYVKTLLGEWASYDYYSDLDHRLCGDGVWEAYYNCFYTKLGTFAFVTRDCYPDAIRLNPDKLHAGYLFNIEPDFDNLHLQEGQEEYLYSDQYNEISSYKQDISYCEANGIGSHAEGIGTKTLGTGSHSEGCKTKANGEDSHAEGYLTIANGYCAHAEGEETEATGEDSHAEGYYTKATGYESHAEGYSSKATGEYSHAEGYGTTAGGTGSHAEGGSTKASGSYSHAEGYNTIAAGGNQHVSGSYNIEDETSLVIVGNGTWNNRSNAYTLDKSGNAWYAGEIVAGNYKLKDGKEIATVDELPVEMTAEDIEALFK